MTSLSSCSQTSAYLMLNLVNVKVSLLPFSFIPHLLLSLIISVAPVLWFNLQTVVLWQIWYDRFAAQILMPSPRQLWEWKTMASKMWFVMLKRSTCNHVCRFSIRSLPRRPIFQSGLFFLQILRTNLAAWAACNIELKSLFQWPCNFILASVHHSSGDWTWDILWSTWLR